MKLASCLLVCCLAGAAAAQGVAAAATAPTSSDISALRKDKSAIKNNQHSIPQHSSKPVRRSVVLSLTSGAPPEVVRLAVGQGTVVSFTDAAGQPWGVRALENFNPAELKVTALGGNSITLVAHTPLAALSNVAVLLEGVASPVSLVVAVGQRQVDHWVHMHVPAQPMPERLPPPSAQAAKAPAAPVLADFVLGTLPVTALPLVTTAFEVKAWQVDATTMVVQLQAELASPAYARRQSSAAGLTFYELPLSAHLVLAARGQTSTVWVSGWEPAKELK